MSLHALVVVVDAEATANVQELEIEALFPDVLDKVYHQHCCIPEDVDLHNARKTSAFRSAEHVCICALLEGNRRCSLGADPEPVK